MAQVLSLILSRSYSCALWSTEVVIQAITAVYTVTVCTFIVYKFTVYTVHSVRLHGSGYVVFAWLHGILHLAYCLYR